jgi:sulfhydrogenase subunit alpha
MGPNKMSPTINFDKAIKLDHLARIEGKAGIEVNIVNNELKEIKINVFEGPRFFEAITFNKPLVEAVAIFPRICSFCSAAHKITALQAAENAIGLTPSNQTQLLRELMYLGDMIESHTLHLYFLAAPDFMKFPSAIAMGKDHPDLISTALKLKDLGADIQKVIGSRYIHQENALIGGFGKIPTKSELIKIKQSLKRNKDDSEKALHLFSKFEQIEEVKASRTHLALKPEDGYSILGEKIHTGKKFEFHREVYNQYIKEKVVAHSFAKHCFFNDEPFMTGALSRVSLNGDTLTGRIKEYIHSYQALIGSNNPLGNNVAQALELIHFIDRSIKITETLVTSLNESEKRIKPSFTKVGRGIAVTEAPRGLLIYEITVNGKGLVTKANIITPTTMFLAMMEVDLRRIIKNHINNGNGQIDELTRKLEILVRAYDPCISCSVHVSEVK